MYLRMLKRDIKDKIGLNIVLFLFMILAAMFMAIGFVMLYSNLYGEKLSYKLCNTSDMVIFVGRETNDLEKNRNRVKELIAEIPECERYSLREIVYIPSNRIDYPDRVDTASLELCYTGYYLSCMPDDMNVPYSIDDEPFYVENGHIAIAQHIAKAANVGVGDKIRITTQMGNIYEFEISVIYKNPSAEAVDMLIVSDADRDLLYAECPHKIDMFELKFFDSLGNYNYEDVVMEHGTKMLSYFDDIHLSVELTKMLFTCDDGTMNLIVSAVMEVIAVFLIAMIFVTINFNLRSAIKREEKEIGMMKAMGVYSFSYKALFAIKYLAFAVVGGFIGLPLALVFSKKLINTFAYHIIFPSRFSQVLLSVGSVLICIIFIIIFTFVSLSRMNKISVMDAIHGENRGERFRKLPGFNLYKSKKTDVALFLAISDILKRIKRYAYLIFAYTFGVSMILLVLQVKDTICSVDYMQKYWQKGDVDFAIIPQDTYMDKLINKVGGTLEIFSYINDELAEHGIPARISISVIANANLKAGDKEYLYYMCFGDFDREDLVITGDGHAPILYNEVAIPAFNAKRDNINIGDIVTIEYSRFTEDHISVEKVTEDFVVTGFFEGFGVNIPSVYMGRDFNGADCHGYNYFDFTMDCDDKDYDMYFNMMDDMYTDEEIRFIHKDGVVDYYLGEWANTFNMLLIVVSIVIGSVLALLTVLYQNIFIEEETADIALLKSMGIGGFTIKLWQFLRIILLVMAAIVLANIFVGTAGRIIMQEVARAVIKVDSFSLTAHLVSNCIIVPFIVIGLVAVTLLPVLKSIDEIKIWRVNNE